jgi:small subunit ribosomal protein S4
MKLFLKGERCYTDKCGYERRAYPPGQHGQNRRRKRSDYGEQLREKQKVKRIYGIAERQFRGYYHKALKATGVTGHTLIQLLERRLDNVVYRMGFADSRAQARQLVMHGHFTVNGRKPNIPSFAVRPNDVVAVREESRKRDYFKDFGEILATHQAPEWLSVDNSQLSGKILNLPARDQIEVPLFNDALIVEHYSR